MESRFSPYKILNHDLNTVYPIHLQVDLTQACNHLCTFCYFSNPEATGVTREEYSRSKGHMPPEIIDKLLQGIEECKIKAVTIVGGGEPTLNLKFCHFIKELNSMNVDWGLITNGYKRFTDTEIREMSNARWVRISVDAGTNEIHSKIHQPLDGDPKSFNRIVQNISKLVEQVRKNQDRRCNIGISYLIIPENVKDMILAYRTFNDLGADYIQFKPAVLKDLGKILATPEMKEKILANLMFVKQLYNDNNDKQKMYVIDLYNRVDILINPQRSSLPCKLVRYRNQVTSNGGVYPCCIFKYNGMQYCYGNLANNSLKEIFDTPRRKNINDTLIPKSCPNCWEDEFNRIADYLLETDKIDVNFV